METVRLPKGSTSISCFVLPDRIAQPHRWPSTRGKVRCRIQGHLALHVIIVPRQAHRSLIITRLSRPRHMYQIYFPTDEYNHDIEGVLPRTQPAHVWGGRG